MGEEGGAQWRGLPGGLGRTLSQVGEGRVRMGGIRGVVHRPFFFFFTLRHTFTQVGVMSSDEKPKWSEPV